MCTSLDHIMAEIGTQCQNRIIFRISWKPHDVNISLVQCDTICRCVIRREKITRQQANSEKTAFIFHLDFFNEQVKLSLFVFTSSRLQCKHKHKLNKRWTLLHYLQCFAQALLHEHLLIACKISKICSTCVSSAYIEHNCTFEAHGCLCHFVITLIITKQPSNSMNSKCNV